MKRSIVEVSCLCCFLMLGGCDTALTEPPPTMIEPTLPSEIAGTVFDVTDVAGDQLFDPADENWRQALAGLGVATSDLRLVIAVPQDSTVDLQIGAFQISGLEWATRLEAFAGEMEAASGGLVAFDRRDVGGKSIQRAVYADDSTGTHSYYYPVGDVLFFVSTADEGMAANVLKVLPSGAGAASASSTAAAAQSASGAASTAQTVYLHLSAPTLPVFPACVGWPASPQQAISVSSILSGGAGIFPYQVIVSAHTPFGETIPPASTGFFHHFLYRSRQFGLGTADRIQLVASVAGVVGPVVQEWPLRVQHCLNGRWLDGERILRIRQTFDNVTATIETGTLTCGEGGQAFSGTLDMEGAIISLRGSDLKACNPETCVEAGHLEKTELREYTAMISDDGGKIDVDWERQLFDREYDDEGNLTDCPRTDVEQESFSIGRLDWGPERPF